MLLNINNLIYIFKVNYKECLLLTGLAVIPGIAVAQESALQELVSTLAMTSTMQARVEQLILSQDGREIQDLQAEIIMQKPDHLFWQVTEPYEELMVSDGETLWYYEPDLEQVSIQDFPDDVENNPILLLNENLQTIAAAYEVSQGFVDDTFRQYILIPQTPNSSYERFSLTFSGTELVQMQFESSVGQLTSFSFSDITSNAAIDPARFIFTIPPGIEVIDSRRSAQQ